MHRADKAIEELKDGNRRFLEKHMENIEITVDNTKKLYNKPQKPMAVVLACSDSRVPPEIVFDQGPGSLFVIRNAGNVIDKHVLGSIEYAIKYLDTPLIFVLGHNMCGAINATVERKSLSSNIDCIVNNILKNIDIKKIDFNDKEKASKILEDENIKRGIVEIRENDIVKTLELEGRVKVRGGKYCLDTGRVKFF
ncbi:MAG: carbonic anhydrase [Andreesenia angusta]|nr:carbonic anhydrase [Andreesenia angusta]